MLPVIILISCEKAENNILNMQLVLIIFNLDSNIHVDCILNLLLGPKRLIA